MTEHRVPAGTPTGGQFAPSAHTEAEVALPAAADPTPAEEWRDRAWDVIAAVRDAAPRHHADASTDDILDALAESGLLAEIEARGHAAGLAEGRKAAETMRGDVHHHVNPVIGWLRMDFHKATGGDPLTVPLGADRLPDVTGLPETIAVPTRQFVSTVRKLQDATDAADAALAESPLRDQRTGA